MSRYSPGIVTKTEALTRFILLSSHVSKKTGRALPNCFSHINSRGCSIQRETIASTDELVSFLNSFFSKNNTDTWYGVLSGVCGHVREIEVDRIVGRAVCVYDTAKSDNPAHGEMCRGIAMDEADKLELRNALFVAFGDGVITEPSRYRNGDIQTQLTGLGIKV